jgi:polar amino acid transport system substrate-binding protein
MMGITMKAKIVVLIAFSFWIVLVSPGAVRAAQYYFVTLDYPPLEFKSERGRIEGAAVELVIQIMNQLGHSVSIEVLPWTRAVKMVRHGMADAIFTIFKNPERELFLDYSNEVLIPQMVALYVPKTRRIAYDGNLETLARYKIGVVSTISYGRRFDSARRMLKVESTASLEQNFAKMARGRIDLVISNVFSADLAISQMHIGEKIERLEPPVETVPSYIAFPRVKDNTQLRINFDHKLMESKTNGSYDRILRKWAIVIP